MACKVIASTCLKVGENKPYGFNLTIFCANHWEPGGVYALTDTIRPREISAGGKGPTGFEYVCTTAGQSASKEPIWPTTVGSTVQDGSAVWTCQAISNNSLGKTISTSSWSTPTGVTSSDDSIVSANGEQKTATFLSADSVLSSGTVVDTVTFSDGHVEEFGLKIKVTT